MDKDSPINVETASEEKKTDAPQLDSDPKNLELPLEQNDPPITDSEGAQSVSYLRVVLCFVIFSGGSRREKKENFPSHNGLKKEENIVFSIKCLEKGKSSKMLQIFQFPLPKGSAPDYIFQ